jgi:hypothetical protein
MLALRGEYPEAALTFQENSISSIDLIKRNSTSLKARSDMPQYGSRHWAFELRLGFVAGAACLS